MSEATKTTYILQMTSRDEFKPKSVDVPGLRVERMEELSPEFSKYLHMRVGHPHKWGGRSEWTQREWSDFVNHPAVQTWVGFFGATPVGYYELQKEQNGAVAIVCFGLIPEFVGRGLGGLFLNRAIECAWDMDATRIWLGTCSHDHPHALENYKARGFTVTATREGPANQPWPSFWEAIASR
jgi:GNAT superfamily N-acetyltransferase